MTGGIYVHVPWCRAICPYCAFDVVRDRGDVPWERYVDRVLEERELRRPELPDRASTLYLGGGTPSRLPPLALARLVRGLAPHAGGEITVEVNPEDAHQDWLSAARACGVTRISLGVQTTDPQGARLLGRGHTSPQAAAAISTVKLLGFPSWTADLMFALPGQTLDALDADLDTLLAWDPPHVSLYGLTFEPGTPFEARRLAGKLQPLPDDLWRTMYDRIVERLHAEGLERYEVSNFARPGHRSEHNRGYWTGRPYLGLGPGAHGFGISGRRWVNHADPARWLTGDPTAHHESPTSEEAAIDHLLSALRAVEGVDLDQLSHDTGQGLEVTAVDGLIDEGLLLREGPRIRLGHDAFPIADAVIGHLVQHLVPSRTNTG